MDSSMMMMELDHPTAFATKDDEIKYWMDLAHEMYQRNEVTLRELHEYQENSQYVEKELELSFWETDKKNRSLSYENSKLATNNEVLRVKLNEQIAAHSALQNEMKTLSAKVNELANNVRQLEQKNDDLERENRELKMVEGEMEARYNDAIEKIALLETDLMEENYATFDKQKWKKEDEDSIDQLENSIECRQDHTKNLVSTEVIKVKPPVHTRSAHNLASATFALFKKNHRETEVKENVIPIKSGLVASSPVRRASQESLTSSKNRIHSARKEKYKTEGRDLSQAFARFSKLQEDRDRNQLNRSIEIRTKKIKEEEKRQRTLSSFVKRIRAARKQLLRRNE